MELWLVIESGVDTDQVVQVADTMQEGFNIVTVEEHLGVDLEDEAFADFEGEPCVMAASRGIVDGK